MTRRRMRTAHRLGTGQGRISLATTSAATVDEERGIDWIAVEGGGRAGGAPPPPRAPAPKSHPPGAGAGAGGGAPGRARP
ncbi:hypothetical protein ACFVHW_07905, partial [Streptomyces sp. NPDC127110]